MWPTRPGSSPANVQRAYGAVSGVWSSVHPHSSLGRRKKTSSSTIVHWGPRPRGVWWDGLFAHVPRKFESRKDPVSGLFISRPSRTSFLRLGHLLVSVLRAEIIWGWDHTHLHPSIDHGYLFFLSQKENWFPPVQLLQDVDPDTCPECAPDELSSQPAASEPQEARGWSRETHRACTPYIENKCTLTRSFLILNR